MVLVLSSFTAIHNKLVEMFCDKSPYDEIAQQNGITYARTMVLAISYLQQYIAN